MKEFEVMTVDNKEYLIVDEIIHKDNDYIYLVNPKNELDVMIRKQSKEDKSLYIPLDSEEEFNLANLLLFKENKKEQ